MKILLRAPLLTVSGYGVHSRQIFDWLYHKDGVEITTECLNWGQTPWYVDPSKENGLIGKIMTCSKPRGEKKFDMSFQVQLPDEWDPSLANINIGISAFVETDRCSQKWIEACNKMDHIVIPSTFTKNVAKRSGKIDTPMTVIPEWFNPVILNKGLITKTLNDDRYNLSTDFNILIVGQLTSQNENDDRKNLINSLKWCCEAFADNKDVGIVVKTNQGKGTTTDKMITTRLLKQKIKEIRSGEFPKIHFIHGNMKSNEIAALYQHRKIKAYVSATRGEGYGLPLIEAAASGLPIVVTNWSGHLEFLEKDLINPVDYDLVDISNSRVDKRIFYSGFKWAEPKKDDFIDQVKNVYQDHKEAKRKAKLLQKNILKNFNSAIIKVKYDNLFNKVK